MLVKSICCFAAVAFTAISAGCGATPSIDEQIDDVVNKDSTIIERVEFHAEWPFESGPNRNYTSKGSVPTKFSAYGREKRNIHDQTPVFFGDSSPVCSDESYFTTYGWGGTGEVVVSACKRPNHLGVGWLAKAINNKNFGKSDASNVPSTLAVNETCIYSSFIDCGRFSVVALNQKTKEIHWRSVLFRNDSFVKYIPAITLWNNLVVQTFFSDEVSFICALNQKDGTLVWRKMLTAGLFQGDPQIVEFGNDEFVIQNEATRIVAINPVTGKLEWEVNHARQTSSSLPIQSKDKIFLTGRECIIAICPFDKKVIWEQPVKSFYASPICFDNVVLVTEDDGDVIAFDQSSGKKTWERQLDSAVKFTPTLINKLLYVGTEKGIVFVIDPSTENGKVVSGNNRFEESIVGSIIVDGNGLVIRTKDFLYCVAESSLERD